MVKHPCEPCHLDSKPDQGELHAELLRPEPLRLELICAGDIEAGLRIANAIWFLVNGPVQLVER